MEYYGLLKIENPDERVELILCANIIPTERKKFLETVGIECKELGINLINQVAQKYNYTFMDAASEVIKSKDEIKAFNKSIISLNDVSATNKVWIFQENPKRYDIVKALDDPEIGNEISWSVKQHKNEISKGDVGLIWRSGDEAGIYAIGEILNNPMMMKDTEAEKKYYLIDSDEGDLLRLMVKIKIVTKLIDNPILKTQIKEIRELQNLSILKMWRGTNFPVTADEWNQIKKILENR
jgi:predicted RNA-binding protein with PUA-like domain